MNESLLFGCAPEPLMNYLKALGVFRLVAEQADPEARLSWRGGIAVLHSKLDRDGLMGFFLEQYRPTPVLAPWNGGSGFYGSGSDPLLCIEKSTTPRFAPYRLTIQAVRKLIPKDKPKDGDKQELLARCRNLLPDEVGAWLDTCFVLRENGPSYFPLLGTGGNDGRLDFTNNFFQRLADVISFSNGSPPKESTGWLNTSLFADGLTPLGKSAIGQFDPGGIGGANGTQGNFEANSQVNPWNFVLMIEGAIFFSGSVARRLGSAHSSRGAFPFTVDSVAVGYGSAIANEETTDGSRAELWLPLWGEATTYEEVRHLFAEGRAQLGRHQAKNSVEFALAINLLGVNRGINVFSRYGFLKRNGLAYLAAPLGRIEVTLRPSAHLLEDPPLAEWVDRLRSACRDKDKTPARYQSAVRHIDRAIFAFANRSGQGDDAEFLLDVLRALGRAEQTLANGLAFCKDKYLRPLCGLSSRWLEQADDGSPEFRLAAGLAGMTRTDDGDIGPLRVFLEKVEMKGRYAGWNPESTSSVWSMQPVATNLVAVFRRRQMESFRSGHVGVPLHSSYLSRLDDVIAFLNQETDDAKLAELLWGLIGVEYPAAVRQPAVSEQDVPFEFGVPRLLVQEKSFFANGDYWNLVNAAEANAKPDPDVFHLLMGGTATAVEQCLTRAARRLKSGGLLVNGYRNRRQSGRPLTVVSQFKPERLLAAMLFPLSYRDLERIANAVLYPPESEE